jgi:hypothetical protein
MKAIFDLLSSILFIVFIVAMRFDELAWRERRAGLFWTAFRYW